MVVPRVRGTRARFLPGEALIWWIVKVATKAEKLRWTKGQTDANQAKEENGVP